MTENFELYWKVVGTVAGAMFTYHKYISAQLDKKVDKTDCETTHKYIKEIREDGNKTLFKSIGEIKDRLIRIEGYFMHNPNNHEN